MPKNTVKQILWEDIWEDDGSDIDFILILKSETCFIHEYEIFITRNKRQTYYCAFLEDQYKVGYGDTIEEIKQKCQEDFQLIYDMMSDNIS